MWRKNIAKKNTDKPYENVNENIHENDKIISQKTQNVDEDIIWMRRIISHNVRMPMAIIKGYGDVLKKGLLGEKERQKAIDSIYENILYLDQILSVVFDYGEVKEIALIRVNICEVLRKVVGYVKDISNNNGVKIVLNTESDEMYIDAELIPIIRIFYQIFDNSFKYLDRGNSVEVSVHSLEDEILIMYKDDGRGMADEDIPHIFERGFRGDNVKGESGSGYGLFDVSETVKKYNGDIEIKSHIGHGFSAFIKFPKSIK